MLIPTLTFAPAPLQNQEQGHKQPVSVSVPATNRQEAATITLPSRGVQAQGREMVVQATAYTHTGERTYSETWPQEGRTIAVDPATIPIGSRVYIREFGRWYVAEDKIPPQSVAKGAKIDIYMDREADCWEWGRRDVRVVVVKPEKGPR